MSENTKELEDVEVGETLEMEDLCESCENMFEQVRADLVKRSTGFFTKTTGYRTHTTTICDKGRPLGKDGYTIIQCSDHSRKKKSKENEDVK